MITRISTNNKSKKRGGVLIVVLVCLSVIGALIFASLQTSLRQRRQLDRELQMEQTRWLAEAGLGHAMELINSSDGDFNKDKPVIIKPKLDGDLAAEVAIEFQQSGGERATTANVTAWIGLADRPETQTRLILDETVNGTSED